MKRDVLTDRGYQKLLTQGVPGQLFNQSLVDFLNCDVLKRFLPERKFKLRGRLNALEIGCGLSSVFESWHGLPRSKWHVHAIDFAPTAIQYAQENSLHGINYKLDNICHLNEQHPYDLILDGHCLQTIVSRHGRKQALENIYRYLNRDGIFVLEHMASHKWMQLEDDGEYNDVSFVFKNKSGIETRYIPPARELEEELLSSGLEIVYFRAYSNFKIIPVDSRMESLTTDPDLVRIILKKR